MVTSERSRSVVVVSPPAIQPGVCGIIARIAVDHLDTLASACLNTNHLKMAGLPLKDHPGAVPGRRRGPLPIGGYAERWPHRGLYRDRGKIRGFVFQPVVAATWCACRGPSSVPAVGVTLAPATSLPHIFPISTPAARSPPGGLSVTRTAWLVRAAMITWETPGPCESRGAAKLSTAIVNLAWRQPIAWSIAR